MKLNYPGDCRGSVGQAMGPDTAGAWYEVTKAEYSDGRSVLTLKPLLKDDPRYLVPDMAGFLWLTDDETPRLP